MTPTTGSWRPPGIIHLPRYSAEQPQPRFWMRTIQDYSTMDIAGLWFVKGRVLLRDLVKN